MPKTTVSLPRRITVRPLRQFAPLHDLLDVQKEWFQQFEQVYLNKLFEDICPIEDIAGERLMLTVKDVVIDQNHGSQEPLSDAELDRIIEECKKKELTYGGVVSAQVELVDRMSGEALFNSRANIGTMPLMTKDGSYIISGVENIVISQIIRSYGIFFAADKKFWLNSFKFIPESGPWIEVSVEKSGAITARINKTRKFPITMLLRVFELETDEVINSLFADSFDEEDFNYIEYTLKKDTTTTAGEAALYIYNKLRPGELIDVDNAISYIKSLFGGERVNLGGIARRKINVKLGTNINKDINYIDLEDIIFALKYLCNLSNHKKWFFVDDADHLANKRIRTAGELLYSHLMPTMRKFQKSTRGKLSVIWLEQKVIFREDATTDDLDVDLMDDEEGGMEEEMTTEEVVQSEKKAKDLDEKYESVIGSIIVWDIVAEDKVIIKDHTKLTAAHIKLIKKHNIDSIIIRPTVRLVDIVNFKMIDNGVRSFFSTSQMSSFADQTNVLAELENKRKMTALWPGGLKKETAKFDVRDVHISHYGRICPIETPEWPSIGLVINLALYSRINEDGFVETPAAKVYNMVHVVEKQLINKYLEEDVLDAKGKVIASEDTFVDEKLAATIVKTINPETKFIKVRPFVSQEVEYISPEQDHKYTIVDGSVPLDEHMNIMSKRVPARQYMEVGYFHYSNITHIDVNPSQVFSPSTALIPFVDHDDSARANMGTNQQRQAVPLLRPEAPLVGTWLESDIVDMTAQVIRASSDGEVIYVGGKRPTKSAEGTSYEGMNYVIKVKYGKEIKEYNLPSFGKSNQKTIIHMRPKVSLGQMVKKGDILAEGASIVDGELSLGKNLRVAFMAWKWYNYEDAMVISKRLVKDDELTSVHIEQYEIEVADTKLWAEETTNDIPWVSLAKLKDLDENGIVRIGSVVKGGDILVGKITPKSEWELSAEEKLIQAVFGDKSKNVKDTSLYLPSGSEGKVIDIVMLDSKSGDRLMPGVKNKIKVYVAMTRKIEIGDKLAGRHGNKGIISVIFPEEDMPFTADGQPVDIVLNPLWVISRMNIGQSFENQLGLVAKSLGTSFAVPLFSGFAADDIERYLLGALSDYDVDQLKQAGLTQDQIDYIVTKLKDAKLPKDGKMDMYDGRTGEKFPQKVTVWYMYLLKLIHMVEDKMHARGVGPYSLITQQPLGGKARSGGQKFGEMEVWALEAYGAVHTLQEMLTIKSDDLQGRNKSYEAIIKWQKVRISGTPESYNLLVNLLKGLSQSIKQLSAEEIEAIDRTRANKIMGLWLRGLTAANIDAYDELGMSSGESLDVVDSESDRKDLMKNIVEDLTEYGQIED
jgi:DNA-directed RNA polymerase subunit beta